MKTILEWVAIGIRCAEQPNSWRYSKIPSARDIELHRSLHWTTALNALIELENFGGLGCVMDFFSGATRMAKSTNRSQIEKNVLLSWSCAALEYARFYASDGVFITEKRRVQHASH